MAVVASWRAVVPESVRKRLRDKVVRAVAEGVGDALHGLRTDVVELRSELGAARHDLAAVSERTARIEADLAAVRQEVVHGRGEVHGHIDDQARLRRRDLAWEADRRALRSSLDFVEQHLGGTNSCPGKLPTLEAALRAVTVPGMFLEFGVATGGTLRIISAAAEGQPVYGFDSFAGLPERWRPGHDAGLFAMSELPEVDGAELVVGLFADVLPGFLEDHPGQVAFLHLDADLYSSTRTVLEAVGPRLGPGSVVLFDEYFNYPGWQEHEHRAWNEYVEAHDLAFEFLGFAVDDEQVFLRLI